MRGDGLDAETCDPPVDAGSAARSAVALTVLLLPDLSRVGERAIVEGNAVRVSRLEPELALPGSSASRPLGDPAISRAPVIIRFDDRGIELESNGALAVDGRAVEGTARVAASALDRGVVLELGRRTVLLLHRISELSLKPLPDLGLVGASDGIERVRREILRAAPHQVPVLVRGETGTGKELVAQAIHSASPRHRGPCIAVNLAALGANVAVAELFGHVKGAFTGALDDRPGYFQKADGGTLFLDEIGEAPAEVQVMLLRALETKTVQAVGARAEERTDVRLVTATDADLNRAVSEGRFRAALLHRLGGYEIHLPPLRERRDDIGRLLIHFLGSLPEGITLSGSMMAKLALYDWPGNVRQLHNVAQQIAISEGDLAAVERLLREEEPASPVAGPHDREAPSRKPADVDRAEVFAAMKRNQWRIERAAQELGVTRPSMYRLIASHPDLRTAKDLTAVELESCRKETSGDLDLMSERLRVSKAGIRARLKEEGLGE